jgi:hypothetical protein
VTPTRTAIDTARDSHVHLDGDADSPRCRRPPPRARQPLPYADAHRLGVPDGDRDGVGIADSHSHHRRAFCASS